MWLEIATESIAVVAEINFDEVLWTSITEVTPQLSEIFIVKMSRLLFQ